LKLNENDTSPGELLGESHSTTPLEFQRPATTPSPKRQNSVLLASSKFTPYAVTGVPPDTGPVLGLKDVKATEDT
jgi:hypothetical protein